MPRSMAAGASALDGHGRDPPAALGSRGPGRSRLDPLEVQALARALLAIDCELGKAGLAEDPAQHRLEAELPQRELERLVVPGVLVLVVLAEHLVDQLHPGPVAVGAPGVAVSGVERADPREARPAALGVGPQVETCVRYDDAQDPPRAQHPVALREERGSLLGVVEVLEEVLGEDAARRLVGEGQAPPAVVQAVDTPAGKGVDVDPALASLIAGTDVDEEVAPLREASADPRVAPSHPGETELATHEHVDVEREVAPYQRPDEP